MTDDPLRPALLGLARTSIESGLGRKRPTPAPELKELPAILSSPGASFVTLTREGRLRGCRGTLEPRLALAHDVWRNAWASAFDDPRFEPLAQEELPDLAVAISLLSPLEPLAVVTEQELLASIEPGRHGLVIACGERRATFLPQVWSSLPLPAEFVGELKAKAGLPRESWSPAIEAWRYTVQSFGDPA